jgi:hypothetical protein
MSFPQGYGFPGKDRGRQASFFLLFLPFGQDGVNGLGYIVTRLFVVQRYAHSGQGDRFLGPGAVWRFFRQRLQGSLAAHTGVAGRGIEVLSRWPSRLFST